MVWARMMTMEVNRSRWIQVEVTELNEGMDWGYGGGHEIKRGIKDDL